MSAKIVYQTIIAPKQSHLALSPSNKSKCLANT